MRSILFVPGDRPERFDKACACGAGAVIIDLEDAVAPADKARARDALADWLQPERAVLVRINAAGTPWFDDDLALLAHVSGVAGIVLPKAECPEEVAAVATCAPVFPLIESAFGLSQVLSIGKVAGIRRLIFGSVDFQLDLGIRGDGPELSFFRSQLVWMSRLAGLAAPIDGVTTILDDTEQLAQDAQRSRAMGFGGKLCIHPRQVSVVNQAFAPTAEEEAWARRVLAAASSEEGAVRLDGQMIDRPVVLRAQAIINEIAARGIQ
ncbi:MAG: CoA ester lyase [Pseudomonas sp.]|uniref:HpcH/HpaI aldolase/citrate lyase family protein n=1 Tax=Pseudomonas sp. TaxID=306 RepID=UPI0039822679